ncbi:hypothetical protein CBR_g16143 [Chara braunii]|uniref:glutathione transferase n=1 Tax=Chara braunii TaxID=69332 RepID=A0A388KTP3_CHABU|nr:hypothetical protein CBR_g16143 [Chara braunii]|eukprot:GBG73427.1 hypothetical protein CBR_g16143 [Chara braunii]
MTYKVYGLPISTCTRRILTVLEEVGADYTLEQLNLAKGEHKQPKFLALQPFGQIPVLEHSDLCIFEAIDIENGQDKDQEENSNDRVMVMGEFLML